MYIVAALSPCGVYLDSIQLTSEGIGADMVNCSWFPESSDPTVCVDEPPTNTSMPSSHGEFSISLLSL
mgnify:FL=1